MAGNKNVYNEAMRSAHNLAWDGRYEMAAHEYRRAAAEAPQDVAAHAGLGAAYMRLGQFHDALAAYEVVREHAPTDMLCLGKIAEIHARLGNRAESAAAFATLTEALSRAGLAERVVETCRQAVILMPDHGLSHARLAVALGAVGRSSEASAEFVHAARLTSAEGRHADAREMAEQAVLYDASNAEAAALLELPIPADTTAAPPAEPVPAAAVPTAAAPATQPAPAAAIPTPVPATPAPLPVPPAPVAPPEPVLSAPEPGAEDRQIQDLLTQADGLRTRGEVDAAIKTYLDAIAAGVRRAEVEYQVGLLCHQAGRYDEAVQHLSLTGKLPAYAFGSLLAIGQCREAQGDTEGALNGFLAATEAVDASTLRREQAGDVTAAYRGLSEAYRRSGQPEEAARTLERLATLLTERGWQDKAAAIQAELLALQSGDQPTVARSEADLPEWKLIAQKLAAFDGYLAEQHYLAAIEECHDVINLAPSYLPVHYRLGTVYTQQGRLEPAVDKYLTLATLHTVRHEAEQAEEACRLAMAAAPADPRPRSRLAQMFLEAGNTEKALEELDVLGDLQLQRGLRNEARDTIRQIIALNPPDAEGYQQLLEQLETSQPPHPVN